MKNYFSWFYLAFTISITARSVSYRRHRPVCFMASEAAPPSELLQLKCSHPIMKPLKMLGCCQMVCHWAGRRGKPAAAETSAPWWFRGCCFASMKAMLGRLETPDRENLIDLEAPLCSIFFINSFIWEKRSKLLLGQQDITECTWETRTCSWTHTGWLLSFLI